MENSIHTPKSITGKKQGYYIRIPKFVMEFFCILENCIHTPKSIAGFFWIYKFWRKYTRTCMDSLWENFRGLAIIRFSYLTIALISEISILWLELYARYDRPVMNRNTERNYFWRQHFVHTCTRNSKTKGRMLTFYISNDCSTIGDVDFLC